jgi:hypothetical protein
METGETGPTVSQTLSSALTCFLARGSQMGPANPR